MHKAKSKKRIAKVARATTKPISIDERKNETKETLDGFTLRHSLTHALSFCVAHAFTYRVRSLVVQNNTDQIMSVKSKQLIKTGSAHEITSSKWIDFHSQKFRDFSLCFLYWIKAAQNWWYAFNQAYDNDCKIQLLHDIHKTPNISKTHTE